MKDALTILSFSILLANCTSTRNTGSRNLAHIYKPDKVALHPEFVVYHHTDSSSQLYFMLNSKELLYSRKENEKEYISKVKISYRLLESYSTNVLYDSSSTIITDQAGMDEAKLIIGHIDINALSSKTYLLEIITEDLYRNQASTHYISIDKSDKYGRQNFLLKSPETGMPMFRNYVKENESITITCNNPNTNKLLGRYYHRKFPLAPPPFSIYNAKPFIYAADSTFTLYFDEEGNATLNPAKPGFYHLQPDTTRNNKKGLTIYHFDNHFPAVQAASQMIQPLRYISTRKEFIGLTENKDHKKAIDQFWLNNSYNIERAKELIKHYYNRLQYANIFFTSYTEGWKTDRGMVYMVFGPPNIIYKSGTLESWVYGEDNNFMSLNFNFSRVNNPFTGNDYSLNRTPVYKNNWYRAVDSWRQGRVFSTN